MGKHLLEFSIGKRHDPFDHVPDFRDLLRGGIRGRYGCFYQQRGRDLVSVQRSLKCHSGFTAGQR